MNKILIEIHKYLGKSKKTLLHKAKNKLFIFYFLSFGEVKVRFRKFGT